MQALRAVLNTADNVKTNKGSRSSQADSITMMIPGEKSSFTGILEQLFSMFPMAASANIDGQSGDKQGMFPNVAGLKAEGEFDKSKDLGNEATLPEIMLAMPAFYIGKPDLSPGKGTMAEAVGTASEVKPSINKYFTAPGDIPFALTQMQPVTQTQETIASGNIQPDIGPTDQASKILTVTQQQERKPAALQSYGKDQLNLDEPIVQTGKETKTSAAEIQPGKGAAAAASFSTDQVFNAPTNQKSKDGKFMTAIEVPVTENAQQTVNSEAARLEFKKAVGQIGKESKIIVTTGQPAGESPHEVTTSSRKDKPVIDEAARPTDKENKNLASIKRQDSDTVKSAVTEVSAKSITTKSIQASSDEVKIKNTTSKKADIEASDTTVKLDSQPSLNNNIQAATERPRPERTVMSKSQIDHIVANLAGQINSGTSSLEINLQPESLGKIKLMFQMDDGSLSVRIIAHSEETRNLLDASLQSIKDSLNQQGIKVNDMSLDLANQEKHGNQNGSSYREASRAFAMMGEKKESHNHTDNWEQNSTQNRRLNILA